MKVSYTYSVETLRQKVVHLNSWDVAEILEVWARSRFAGQVSVNFKADIPSIEIFIRDSNKIEKGNSIVDIDLSDDLFVKLPTMEDIEKARIDKDDIPF